MFGIGSRGRPKRRWMGEVVETTGLLLQDLKEEVRDRVDGEMWSESSLGDFCVPIEQGKWINTVDRLVDTQSLSTIIG